MSIRICGDNTTASPAITSASDTDTGLQFGTNEVKVVNGNLDITDGNMKVASGHGIDFSADANAAGMTSELLADYEEGTFTLTLADVSTSDELTDYDAGSINSKTVARYVRVGQMCYLTFHAPYFQNGSNTGAIDVSGSAPFESKFPVTLRADGPMRGFDDANTRQKGPVVVIAANNSRGSGGTNFYLHTADAFSNSSGYDATGGWSREFAYNAPGLFISGSYIIADGS